MSEGSDTRPPKPAQHPPPLDLLPFALLIIVWLVALAHYSRLPELIPSSFRLNGTPSAWAGKASVTLLLPMVGTLAYLSLNLVGRIALRRPTLGGRPFKGRAARRVGELLVRYLFCMKTCILTFLLNIEFRSIQIAYGVRESLAWDSYLVGALLVFYAVVGSAILYLNARHLMKWQDTVESGA